MVKKTWRKKTIVKVRGGSTEYGQRPYFPAFKFWDPSLIDLRFRPPKLNLFQKFGMT